MKGKTPIEDIPLKLGKSKTTAAGIPAIISSAKQSLKKMGLSNTIKTLRMVNQQDGFDCPGCAWPDPEHRSSFEFCENGAKAVANEAMKANVDAKFFTKYSLKELTKKSDYWLNNQGRIKQPMYLASGATHYTPISWEKSLELISNKLNSLPNPNRAVFYTSGRTSNEAAFLYQAFVRLFGTNNLPDCSNMCHESSGKALVQTIGIGKGTVTLDDFNHADAILVIGQNPGTNHPRMLTALRDAKLNGAKIIHINPLPETGLVRFKHPQDYMKLDLSSTGLADMHLQVKIGGDAALLQAINKLTIDSESIDLLGIDSGDELLRSIIQQGTNKFNDAGNAIAGVNSARGDIGAYNLRNLGTGNTLVLLNGRRMINSPGFQSESVGGSFIPVNSVNTNTLPIGGIERLEILRDGASAIYGADAVAGVVNTVLDRDYEGFSVSAKYSEFENFARSDNRFIFKYLSLIHI